MLRDIGDALETAQGPLSLRQLSQQLGVEESALEGMIELLVRKGWLRLADEQMVGRGCGACSMDGVCRLQARSPRRYVLAHSG